MLKLSHSALQNNIWVNLYYLEYVLTLYSMFEFIVFILERNVRNFFYIFYNIVLKNVNSSLTV